jgi:FkbM family methyltransferase
MQSMKVVRLTTKRGFFLNAFEADSITKEVERKGEYDANTLNSLSDVLAEIKPQLSLDVGANIGNHTLVISKLSENVVAFEPVKFVFDVLQTNLEQNQISNVNAVNLGLSDKEMETEIFIPSNGNLGSSSLEAKEGNGTLLRVTTTIGDHYLNDHFSNQQIDFIKMDVEGHEAMALLGLHETIAKNQPLLLLEWKSQNTLISFQEHDLFNKLFSEYKQFSLSYTSNKKVHANTIVGYLTRIYHKIVGSQWCLSTFDENKYYSNVYFVPPRYQSVMQKFTYME